jgi:hypothetical protein
MSQSHNVFISWSGERSNAVALKLREWLPRVIQAAKPWMSDIDIAKGSRGLNEVMKALSSMKVGIICLSPQNLETPWLLYEAGALSKAIDDSSRLCTYLLDGLEPEDVKPPLGMFQATRASKEDSRKLIQTINLSVSDDPLSDEDFDAVFDAMWPSLETTIKSLPLIEPTRAVRRKTDDMIIEILEIVRSEANRNRVEVVQMQPAIEQPRTKVESISREITRQQRFLGELVDHATGWRIDGNAVRLIFSSKNRAIGEMLQAKDAMTRLRIIASKVLGVRADVQIEIEGDPGTFDTDK